jgi:acetyl esterase/lipase
MRFTLKLRLIALGLVALLVAPVAAEDKPKADVKPAAKKPAAKPAPTRSREPTAADVSYGPHPKQIIDFYQAESQEPTPLVVYIHGGGWMGGSKLGINPDVYLREGISVVSVEYRFIPEATADGVKPPVKGPLHDAARSIQFVRNKAKEWNIDPTRVGATGGSAGACSSLWLAFHDDLADPKSDDPVARQSTRLTCAAVQGAQTSLDPKQMKEWMPNSKYGAHAFGIAGDIDKRISAFDAFLAARDEILPWIKEYSPYELVTKDDPPVALYYGAAPEMGKEAKDPTHSANFGLGLQEKCKQEGVECHLVYQGGTDNEYPFAHNFLIAKLKPKK